ncbi:hypothetical protein ACOCJ5_07640 [Knoellia sp. CPCC 206450]|uniref:hypothetical protein n=1 Tax=Knoellia tibetensis TaxID=3404798 RepID=UPI003B433952
MNHREGDFLLLRLSAVPSTLRTMWESPQQLWRRLKLGREEFLQRVLTTLIVDGDPPQWNAPRTPSEQGIRFLRLLDVLAHGDELRAQAAPDPEVFVDEYLLPKLQEAAMNGWPDWAVLWPDRAWVIELKTEPGSHRADQLPYYLRLAAAAHPSCRVDVTYITGPLTKPAPALGDGQRYSHLQWIQVLPLVHDVWGNDERPEVRGYVEAARTVIENLTLLRPTEQRRAITGMLPTVPIPAEDPKPTTELQDIPTPATPVTSDATSEDGLLALAQATAADGRQRGTGATSPADLELLRDTARTLIGTLPDDDVTRYVMPWLWKAGSTTGRALTAEGDEFGYELRFSRYKTVQVKP